MTEELKPLPCPFCGGTPQLKKIEDGDTIFVVACENEPCSHRIIAFAEGDARNDAIKAWNTRSPAWRDIESAPQGKQEPVIVWGPDFETPVIAMSVYSGREWTVCDHKGMTLDRSEWEMADCNPAYWMPLPLPPEETK